MPRGRHGVCPDIPAGSCPVHTAPAIGHGVFETDLSTGTVYWSLLLRLSSNSVQYALAEIRLKFRRCKLHRELALTTPQICNSKLTYCLGFLACALVVFVVALMVSILAHTPVVFLRLAELDRGTRRGVVIGMMAR